MASCNRRSHSRRVSVFEAIVKHCALKSVVANATRMGRGVRRCSRKACVALLPSNCLEARTYSTRQTTTSISYSAQHLKARSFGATALSGWQLFVVRVLRSSQQDKHACEEHGRNQRLVCRGRAPHRRFKPRGRDWSM